MIYINKMDIFNYIKNNIEIRKIANGSLKAGSKIMTKFLLDLMDDNNNFVSKTNLNIGSLNEDIKKLEKSIIISNHPSFFDFVIVKKAIDCYCLTDNVDSDVLPTEYYMNEFHLIPYYKDENNCGKNAQELILKTVNEGKKVLVFPEGTIQTSIDLKTFKKGLFHLAYDNNIPIISMNIIIKSSFDDKYLESLFAYFQIPTEPPEIDVYYNEMIYPKDFTSFESFYDKCFESVSVGYYDRLEIKNEKN